MNNEFFNQGLEMQKNIMGMWTNTVFNTANKEETNKEENKNQTPYEEMANNYFSVFNNYMDGLKNSSDLNNNFSYVANPYETFKNISGGMDRYQSLYKFWEDLSKMGKSNTEETMKEFMENLKNNYSKILNDNVLSLLPTQMKEAVEDNMKNWENYINLNKQIFAPWFKDQDIYKNYWKNGLTGDVDTSLNLLRLFNQNFEETFGKFMNMSNIGFNTEQRKEQMESFEAYLKYTATSNEFIGIIYKVGMETCEELIKKYTDLLKTGSNPKDFKEFYEFWMKTNEDAYTDLFKTENFSKMFGHLIQNGSIFKQKFDRVLEKQISFLPVPNRTEMKSLYKTVYDLRKQVKALTKESESLEELKKEVESLKALQKDVESLKALQKDVESLKKAESSTTTQKSTTRGTTSK